MVFVMRYLFIIVAGSEKESGFCEIYVHRNGVMDEPKIILLTLNIVLYNNSKHKGRYTGSDFNLYGVTLFNRNLENMKIEVWEIECLKCCFLC